MTFQANVRATFQLARFARRASIVALAATFLTAVALGRQSDPLVAYLLLFFSIVLVAVVHTLVAKVDIIAHESLRLRNIGRPIAFALVLSLVVYVILFVTFRFPLVGRAAEENAWLVLFMGIIVGFIEELGRFVWLQVMPLSVFSANGLWVLLHPQVGRAFGGEMPDFFFATFAFVFGLAMTLVMWLYERRLPGGFNRALGPVAAMGIHAGYNTLVILWAVKVFGLEFGVL